MSCGIKILSNNLLNEVVFVSVTQGNQIFNLGEKTIPFNVLTINGSNTLSGTYNIYSSTYRTNYTLIVPDSPDIVICVTPTPTPSNTTTPTVTPTITPTNTVTPTQTITPTVTPSITPTRTVTPSITPTTLPTCDLIITDI